MRAPVINTLTRSRGFLVFCSSAFWRFGILIPQTWYRDSNVNPLRSHEILNKVIQPQSNLSRRCKSQLPTNKEGGLMKAHVEDARKVLVLVLRKNSRESWRRVVALAVAVVFALYPVAPASLAWPAPAKAATHLAAAASSAQGGCTLNSPRGKVSHVIYIQFDNTHFTRDNPDVPSDLEQMPHLLNFLEQSGVILTNHHTPLISHTANDILT